MTHVGALLRSYREDRGLSQEALAERAGAGLSVNTISNIERGRTRPYQHTVEALCQALGLTEREQGEVLSTWTQAGLGVKRSTQSTLPRAGPVADSLHRTTLPLLIGREQEAGQALRLVRGGARLLTLTGPGGVGKTRLALHLAEQLASEGEVFFIPLATVDDPQVVPTVIAERLGIEDAGAAAPEELVVQALGDHQAVLVLDNFEQVVDASLFIAQLLDHCPHLRILTTSRVPLHLQGEQELPVPPLPVPPAQERLSLEELTRYPAVGLFLQRARAVRPDFQLTAEQAGAMAEICRRLDGIPLAIELAAARVKMLAPTALLARLHLRLLTHGPRDLPARQQTMWDAIAWSYDLLDPNDQVLFRTLSIFRGGCSLEAIAAVYTGEADVLDGVATLVDQSLLTADAGEEPRFRLLEPIREYAAERLEERGEAEQIRRRHAHHFLAVTRRGESSTMGPAERSAWMDRLTAERDNLTAALAWFVQRRAPEGTVRMALALAPFWMSKGYLSEGRRWLEAALEVTGRDAVERGDVLMWLGPLARYAGDLDGARRFYADAVELRRNLGDRAALAESLTYLAPVLWELGEPGKARALWEEVLGLASELGNEPMRAKPLGGLGNLARYSGNYEEARRLLSESVGVLRTAGAHATLAWFLGILGVVEAEQGEYERGQAHAEEALAISRDNHSERGVVAALTQLASLSLIRGDSVEALRLAREAVDLARGLEDKERLMQALVDLGVALTEAGDAEQAGEILEEGLDLASRQGDTTLVTDYLESLAALAVTRGEAERAASLFGAAEAARERLGAALSPSQRARHLRYAEAGRRQLGDVSWQAAWQEGRVMTARTAIACALSSTRRQGAAHRSA